MDGFRGLKIIAGRARAGKTYRLFEKIKSMIYETRADSKNGNNCAYLIVPDQATVIYEDLLVRHIGGKGLLNIEIMSFSRLVERITEKNGLRGKIPVDGVGKKILIGKAVRQLKKEGEIFAKGSVSFGFLSKLSDLISEFSLSGYSAEMLLESIDKIEEDSLKFKASEIQKVYLQYEKLIEGIYIDVEKQSEIAGGIIAGDEDYKNSNIFIDGFFSYSGHEMQLIESFLLNGGNVAVTVLMDPDIICRYGDTKMPGGIDDGRHADFHIFEPTVGTVFHLRKFCAENKIKYEMESPASQNNLFSGELVHLEKNIFAWPASPYEGDVDVISLEKCRSVFDEVERAAISISERVRDEGASYRNIAVVCGDIGVYPPIIKRIFSDYEIPVFIDDKRSVKYYPPVKAMSAVLEAISTGFGGDSVYRIMKSGMYDLKRNKLEKLEIYAKEKGIKYAKWFKKIDDEELEETRDWFISPIGRLSKKIKSQRDAMQISRSLMEYIEEMRFSDILSNKIEKLTGEGQLEIASEYAQSWNAAMSVIEQLVEVSVDYEIDDNEYMNMLKDGFNVHTAGIVPTSFDCVMIGDVQRSIIEDVKHLYIVGFNDGNIPCLNLNSGIMTSREKEILKKSGIKLKSEFDEMSMYDSLKIYSLLSKPRETLNISYTVSSLDGETCTPSLILERLFLFGDRIFKKMKVRGFSLENEISKFDLRMVNSPVSTIKQLCKLKRDVYETSGYVKSVLDAISEIDEMSDKLIAIGCGKSHCNDFEKIDEFLAKSAFPSGMSISISRIEKFNECPFSHLVRYGIRPGEQREYEIRGDEMGIIYHGVLEELLKMLRDGGQVATRDIVDKTVDGKITSLTAKGQISDIFCDAGVGRYVAKKIKRRLAESVKHLDIQLKSGKFTPYMLEAEFGKDADTEIDPIVISDGEREVVIEGRIDRVDVADTGDGKTYIRVIDYKSGEKELSLSDIVDGTSIQLFHYLNAVIENVKNTGFSDIRPAGAYYFRVYEPVISLENEDQLECLDRKKTDKMALNGITFSNDESIELLDADYDDKTRGFEIIEGLQRELKKSYTNESGNVINEEYFGPLSEVVFDNTRKTCMSLIKGYSKAYPLKKGTACACDYCNYSPICQFENGFSGNEERIISPEKTAETVRLLESKIKRGIKDE